MRTDNGNTGEVGGGEEGGRISRIADQLALEKGDERGRDLVGPKLKRSMIKIQPYDCIHAPGREVDYSRLSPMARIYTGQHERQRRIKKSQN